MLFLYDDLNMGIQMEQPEECIDEKKIYLACKLRDSIPAFKEAIAGCMARLIT